ncbi:MFS transporter [Rothia amarae]|uniref:MFS transporter n=2 Tax=Rothia TaxID=32207 RepID=A0A7H2BLG8_9MICC|nr:MFS transporter [Rothia amarae]QNV40514.1 MFS transporter [Rothia amarae]
MLIAVTPLAASVALLGWTGAFSSLALIALALMVLIFILLKDTPGSLPLARRLFKPQNTATEQRTSATTVAVPITDALPVLGPGSSGIVPALKSLLKRPGVRLGFWVHFATCFSTNSFVLLWGLPFMTGGLGYSFATASTIVSLNVVALMAAGLIAGPLFTRFIRQRVEIVTGLVAVIAALWCAVLLYPGGAPVWLMTLTAMIGGIGGPASMVAFEVVRTHAPYTQRGIATGIANMGGFLGALVNVLAIGLILDFTGAGTPDTYNLESFRWAMAFQVPLMILGITMMLIERPKAQKYLREKGLR